MARYRLWVGTAHVLGGGGNRNRLNNNVVEGTIAEVAYLGTSRKYVVDLPDGGTAPEMAITLPDTDGAAFAGGDLFPTFAVSDATPGGA